MRFGVDTFIWSEVFSEKDIWVITKAGGAGLLYHRYCHCPSGKLSDAACKGRAGKDKAGGSHNNDTGCTDESDIGG